VSGRRAKALRREQGGFKKKQKQPTPILESSYIQAPVGYDPIEREYIYRSGKQVRKYLARRGVDVAALEAELNALVAEANAETEGKPE
jgi:glutamate formiminotransferase